MMILYHPKVRQQKEEAESSEGLRGEVLLENINI
jgi:hypothetical protein